MTTMHKTQMKTVCETYERKEGLLGDVPGHQVAVERQSESLLQMHEHEKMCV